MRIVRSFTLWIGSLGLPLVVAGCSGPDATGDNNVDVAAAAARAQANIANTHAAVPEDKGASAVPTLTPAVSPTLGTPAPISDDATPREVVRRYTEALAAGRYDEAWALWDEQGKASGMTRAAFAARFARYATFHATVGTPFDADAGAGQRYVTVPVTVTGTLTSGAPFRLEGPVVLHKAADGIEADDPHAHAWRIRNSEINPQPADRKAGSS